MRYSAQISTNEQDEAGPAETTSLFDPDHEVSDDALVRGYWGTSVVDSEFYLSERVARLAAVVLAGLLIAGALVWLWVSTTLFSPPDLVCSGCDDSWFRWTQLLLALAGIAMTVVVVVYLTYFWRTGAVWRHRRLVANGFGLLVGAWALVLIVVLPGPF